MRLLWHCGFWDGPLSGICLFNGRKHWFRIAAAEVDSEENRIFEIIYLTDDQIRLEEERHVVWVENVGCHCDYDEFNKRPIGNIKPSEKWRNFYDLPPLKRNYTDVVAVVSESELRSCEPRF